MTETTQAPAFTPVAPLPKAQATVPANGAKRPRKAAAKRGVKRAKRKASSEKQSRRPRVANITMDVAAAFELLGAVKKKEIATVQAIVQTLNEHAPKSRLRVMQAVAKILE